MSTWRCRPRAGTISALGLATVAVLGTTIACHDEAGPPVPPRSSSEADASAEGAPRISVTDVVLVTVDTLRWDAVGFAGNELADTPLLDRLADRGLVFDQARSHAVMTLPSHASLLTGVLPYEHGVRTNTGAALGPEATTLAERLADAGWATAAFVGAFPLDARFGLDQGFDLYDDAYPEGADADAFSMVERPGDAVVSAATSWWAEHEGDRRFLWVHLFDPHTPYEPPAPFAEAFANDPYLGEVAAVDRYLAPLLEPLVDDESGATMIIFTSDHGEGLGDHGELSHGLFAYDSTLRVPLVIVAPGVPPDRRDDVVSHVDVVPTVLRAVGLEPASDLPGRDLFSGADDPRPHYFEALDAHLGRGWAPLTGVVAGVHKAIVLPIPELYDLSADPEEAVNLAATDRNRFRELAALVPDEALRLDRAAPSTANTDALATLGYVGGQAAPKSSYGPEDDPKRLVVVDQALHQLIDFYYRGRFGDAVTVGQRIVAEHPSLGIAAYYLAQVFLEMDRPGDALAALDTAYREGSRDPSAIRQLALLMARAGRPDDGLDALATLGPPSDPETLITLGTLRSEAGDQSGARDALLEVFELDPRNPRANVQLALVALRVQAWGEAERRARLALDASPEIPDAMNYLGVALYNLGRSDEAVAAWVEATRIQPNDYDLLYNLGVVAAEIGSTSEARRALERFVAEAPIARYQPDIGRARQLLRQLESR